MNVKIKKKSWIWKLTFPFAHKNTTTWNGVIYTKDGSIGAQTLAHELIHIKQQAEVGKWKFAFLYLFCLPFKYNKYRWNWEMEAYIHGSKITLAQTKEILKSTTYGWLQEP